VITFEQNKGDLFASIMGALPGVSGGGSAEEFINKLERWARDPGGLLACDYEDDWHSITAGVAELRKMWKAGKRGNALVQLWQIAGYLNQMSMERNETRAIKEGQRPLREKLERQRQDRQRGGAVTAGLGGEKALDERALRIKELWRTTRPKYLSDSACALAISAEVGLTQNTVLKRAILLRLRKQKGTRFRSSN